MKKLVVKMEVIAYGMVHHVPKAFLYLQVFLPAYMAKTYPATLRRSLNNRFLYGNVFSFVINALTN